jgi:proline dehydrogenase
MAVTDRAQPGELSSDTVPERPKGVKRLRAAARRAVSGVLLPLMQRAGRAYVGGETVGDALIVARRLAAEGFPSTLGLWDAPEDTARKVADEYLAAIDHLGGGGLDSYVSIKPPALRFDGQLATELAAAGHVHGVRLHFDSHGPQVVDPSNAMLETMLQHLSRDHLSTTLPGRWSRSLSDAEWAVEHGLAVRVVKGQWPDPTDPGRDMRAGFLEVIDRLAGRARRVAVASHDVPLAAESIGRLRAAGTPCELELLFGLPMTRSLLWARENGAVVRIYVPYGKGYLPHAVNQLRRNPRFLWWILKDLVAARLPAPRR